LALIPSLKERFAIPAHERIFGRATRLTPEDENLDSLFARADAAMYHAKRQGKNRIVSG